MKKTSMAIVCSLAGTFGLSTANVSASFDFSVAGGQTSVLLDTETLSEAASLNLSGVSPEVIVPGEIGDGSVAFGINSTDADAPTTFGYDQGLSDFGGVIEHTGSVFFNDGTIEVGNFRIGFDADRVGDETSGFFVESTTGIEAILFDVGTPDSLTADESGLVIGADLLVSAGFAQFLLDNQFAEADLTGAIVGSALVNATLPAPGAIAVLALAGLAGSTRRRQ